MLVPDIDVGRVLLINLELRDDKVRFHGVSYPILPHYLCPYQSQSRVSLQPSCGYASTSSKRGMAGYEGCANAVVATIVLRFGRHL